MRFNFPAVVRKALGPNKTDQATSFRGGRQTRRDFIQDTVDPRNNTLERSESFMLHRGSLYIED